RLTWRSASSIRAPPPPPPPLFPYTTLFRSLALRPDGPLRDPLLRPPPRPALPEEDRAQRLQGRARVERGDRALPRRGALRPRRRDRKSTRLNSSHVSISYAVFCLKKKISNR